MDNRLYKPSGKFSLSFFLIYPFVIPILLAILGFLYAHIIYFSPIVQLNFLVVFFSGIIAGFIVGIAIKLGKVRNQILTIIIALASSALLKYLTWIFYIPLVYTGGWNSSFIEELQASISHLLFNPAFLLEHIKYINYHGVWSLANTNTNVSGIFLYIIWIIEFAVIVGCCIYSARDKVKEPFCEEQNKWFTESKELKLNFPSDSYQLKEQLLTGNNEDFLALISQPLNVTTDDHISVKLYVLEGISYGYMSLKTLTKILDKKGNQKTEKQTLVDYLRIDMSLLSVLQNQLRAEALRTNKK